MTTIAKQDHKAKLVRTDLLPERINDLINVEAWARSIVYKTKYVEPNPDFISEMLAFKIITATSLDEIFQQAKIEHLQQMVPNTPGANTGAIEITDIYVAASDFEQGNPCYVILTWTDLELGAEHRVGTGATNVQATLIALLANGQWPIRCKIMRGDQKGKGEEYLFFVVPPDQEYIG